MPTNTKVGSQTKDLFEKAKGLKEATVASIRDKVLETIDPEVNELILRELQNEASKQASLKEIHGGFEDENEDLEDPIPDLDDDNMDLEDSPEVSRGSKAEDISVGEDELGEESDVEINEPLPTENELDNGDFEVLQIKIGGREFEADFSEGDDKIVFKAVDAPEEGEEHLEANLEIEKEPDSVEMPSGEEDETVEFESEDEFEDGDIPFEEDEEEEERDRLRYEVLSRIRAKRGSGASEEDILNELRGTISERLHEKLATNLHEHAKKPKRKVSIEEHLQKRNLSPEKFNKGTLTEDDEKYLHRRLADLCNLGD
jgi:hypothetical protein